VGDVRIDLPRCAYVCSSRLESVHVHGPENERVVSGYEKIPSASGHLWFTVTNVTPSLYEHTANYPKSAHGEAPSLIDNSIF
jgi:hypothetical protein